MSINWNNLRSWNGSQANSFEELCCQLAVAESVPAGSRFFRKGTPDAGVECFWRLPNSDEWGWQAKFFRTAPNATQWREIDESLKNAVEKHPRLTKYTICLPVDRSDARIGNQKSFLAKWGDYVAKWQRLAATKGMSVTFEYWGQSEIGGRLSDERHRGRHWFWFNEDRLSTAWFISRVDEAVENARDRYSPELNIDLPIRNNFDALGRTPAFFQRLERLYSEARIMFKKLLPEAEIESLKEKYENVFKMGPELFAKIEPWVKRENYYSEWNVTQPISWEDIGWLARELTSATDDCISQIYELQDTLKQQERKDAQRSNEALNSQLYHLRNFRQSVSEIAYYSKTDECILSNRPALLLVGRAGQGKTHLLCDVAKRETYDNRPCLIFHGEQFRDDEPWSQMIRLMGLNCSREEFIGALEAAAQANNCRVLIFIDALNEGEGNRLWWKFLPGILTILAQSQWLGICFSIRSSYEKYIIPDTLDEKRIVLVEHVGFGDLSYKAATKFFCYFGIEPSTPLLLPEFDNPLFLKLFCKSLHNAGMTRVPKGLRGITAIFRFFIESIDKKLARPEWLDYDFRSRIVTQAIELLANKMVKRKSDRLPLEDAKGIVNGMLPREGHQKSLFHHLESEGVLTVVPDYWPGKDEGWKESVRFTYQRFSDHLITQRLLQQHLDKKKPKESFKKSRTLGRLVKDERACWMNRGILEALAIQVPELTKKELPDLAPHLATFRPMREAFVEGIIWRDAGSFTRATDRYINKQVLAYHGTFEGFWNAVITLATTPNHPLNADRLHAVLNRYSLADRDAWWSIFLHYQWGGKQAVDRLVEWAWEENDKSVFDDEVIRLAGITLAWFFSTANRFLRDRATKAMVRLCEKRIHVLRQIMEKFREVNDPYACERLYAVAYGCAMRTTDNGSLKGLAQDVYRWLFESGQAPPHILLRDYARGVIELALYRKIKLDIDVARIRPPYLSDWPSIDVPEVDEIKAWGEWEEGMPKEQWARVHLYSSVMGQEDFSRYVIGDLDEWSSQRIDEPHKPTREELHDQFITSLTHPQKEAWDLYINIQKNIAFYRRLEPDRRKEYFEREFTDAELDGSLKAEEQNLVRVLRKSSKKYKLFRDVLADYIAAPHKYYREDAFDGQLARRWMMKKIIDMGWTVERFGEFDRNVNRFSSHGREARKPERIGKKYQWIAYHELLARLSDNFKMRKEKWSVQSVNYHGPWNPDVRDIDPSNLLGSTQRDEWSPHTNTWWFPTRFNSWDEPVDEVEWLTNIHDVPSIEGIINVTNPQDGSRWFTIHGYYNWQQPTPAGEERYEGKRRGLWYMLMCYLVKKADSTKLLKWAEKQRWMGRWMPESHETYDIFLGEFYWSPAFRDQDCYYYGRQGWTRGRDDRIPTEILMANDEYAQESRGFDCSIDDSIFIDLPCRFLAEGLNLDWRGVEGNWYDDGGQLIAFDPSVKCQGPRVSLFHRDLLIDFLNRQGLTLFWTLLGEKRTIGGRMSHQDYKGHLEINGAYILKNNVVTGKTHSRYITPHG